MGLENGEGGICAEFPSESEFVDNSEGLVKILED